jgi:hypothetical protein
VDNFHLSVRGLILLGRRDCFWHDVVWREDGTFGYDASKDEDSSLGWNQSLYSFPTVRLLSFSYV